MFYINTTAILLKKDNYLGDDFFLTFLTQERGKVRIIAKNAKKSIKRFSGHLEPFSIMEISYSQNKGMAILKEASLISSFDETIGIEINLYAYFAYFFELLIFYLEEGKKEDFVYQLVLWLLSEAKHYDTDFLSIIFHLKFFQNAGISPSFEKCFKCNKDSKDQHHVIFDVKEAQVFCNSCFQANGDSRRFFTLSAGEISEILWLKEHSLLNCTKIQIKEKSKEEIIKVLEAFALFHVKNPIKSVSFLNQIRAI